MATSGTYDYSPSLGELTLYAYNLIGIRNTAILQEHLEASRMAANMMLARWANLGVNLWAVDLVDVPLLQEIVVTGASGDGAIATFVYSDENTPIFTPGTSVNVSGVSPSGYNAIYQVIASGPGYFTGASTETGTFVSSGIATPMDGVATYSVNPNTVMILDAYIRTDDYGNFIDRIISPISRTEYASYANKEQQGFPTVYWFDRLINPTITLWPVPQTTNLSQSLRYYRVKRIQDSNFSNGQQVEIPYLWLEAFAYGLAHRLAAIWMPEKVPLMAPLAQEAYDIAAGRNVERAAFYISPIISGYYR